MKQIIRFPGFYTIGLIVFVFITTLALVGSFNLAINYTNTESFCISCHEMKANSFEEYKDTVHASNRSGVKASCPDCHVPREFFPKIYAKIMAVKDVYHHLMGTIDSKEKFEEAKLEMAQTVWQKMKQSDSRECRVCHAISAMDFDEQKGRAKRKHQKIEEKGKTCIDCHKGVAHELPDDYDQDTPDQTDLG